jgi:hypothetical protein
VTSFRSALPEKTWRSTEIGTHRVALARKESIVLTKTGAKLLDFDFEWLSEFIKTMRQYGRVRRRDGASPPAP